MPPPPAPPQATPAPAIEIRALGRVYPGTRTRPPLTALGSIDLSIERGTLVALLGPNGSGKSTLLRILATLDQPTRGSCSMLGLDGARQRPEIPGHLGVVFQSPSLDPLLTVRENLRLHAGVLGLTPSRGEEAIARLLTRLGVADRARDRVSTLSGGLARRVDLARALLHEPELVLLDEPTSSLDPRARTGFIALMRSLVDDADATQPTVLVATHSMDVAERADRVIMLHKGAIVADGQPHDLRHDLGELALSARPGEHASDVRTAWSGAGLRPVERDGILRAALGDASVPDGAISALVERRVPFEVAPPTLADVFLERTGASLDHDGADGQDTP